MRKTAFVNLLLPLLATGMLLTGCGSSGGGSADPFTITSDDAPDATFTSMATGNIEQGLFWAVDSVWDETMQVRVPAKATARRSPLAASLAGMKAAARSGAAAPANVIVPTDWVVDAWCGDGYATIDGTVNYNAVTGTATANLTATFTNYDTCYGSVVDGDAVIELTAVDLDDGDESFDTIDVTMTMDDLTVDSYPGLVMVLSGTIDVDGDFHNSDYVATMNARTSGGDIALKFVDFEVYFNESAWPQVTGTINGTIYADGDYVKVSTLEDIRVPDMEDNPAPDQGVLLLDGNGNLTVTFGVSVDGETVLLELDGNEDGDYEDSSDWVAGHMYWDEFFALLSFD